LLLADRSQLKTQVPSENANGITTTSPIFRVRTSAPTASTTPIASWHDRVGRLDHGGIGNVLDVNVTGAVHDVACIVTYLVLQP